MKPRCKAASLPTVFALAISSAWLCAQDDVDKLKQSNLQTSLHAERYLAQEAQRSVGPRKYHERVAPQDQSAFDSSSKEIVNAYQKQTRDFDTGYTLLKGNNLLVGSTLAASVILAGPTGGTSLLLTGLVAGANSGLGVVNNIFEKQGREAIRQNLKANLDNARHKMSANEFATLATTTDPVVFRAAIERYTGDVLGNDFAAIPKEDQDLVNGYYNKYLAEVLNSGLQSLSTVQSIQGAQIRANQRSIMGLGRTFEAYARQTQGVLADISKTQSELVAQGAALADHVEGIHEFLFARMTASEQRAALRGGIFPGMPPTDRAALDKTLALVERREHLEQTLRQYVGGADSIVQIAENLGVDRQLTGKAREAVAAGSHVVEAFTALSSGNVLGGLVAASSLFGLGGGRDVAGERHDQIMAAIGQVYEQVVDVKARVMDLQQGQRRIEERQEVIYREVVSLSDRVAQQHEAEMAELARIRAGLLYNRAMILLPIREEYEMCEVLFKAGRRALDVSKGIYPTYGELQTLLENRRLEYQGCLTRVHRAKELDGFNSGAFALRSYEEPSNNVDEFLRDTYAPSVQLLRATIPPGEYNADERLTSLLNPMRDVDGLDAKLAAPSGGWESRFTATTIDQLLYPPMVAQHVRFVIQLHFYEQLVRADYTVITAAELLSGVRVRTAGYYDLEESLELVDAALAQQVLLSGDVLLPLMCHIVTTPKDLADPALAAAASALVKTNPLVAKNMLVYAFHRDVLSRSNPIAYALALASSDSDMLEQIASSRWAFVHSAVEERKDGVVIKPQGWAVQIGEAYVGLPTPVEVTDGRLEYGPDVAVLLQLRERLADEMLSYKLSDSLSPELKRELKLMIMNSL